MYDITTKNIPNAEAALKDMEKRFDLAAKKATEAVGNKAIEVIGETIVPIYNDGHRRPDGRTTDSPIGTPPMTRSGALRANLVSIVNKEGFGEYTAIVGSQVEYARALELGLSNGARYPYLQPAYDTMVEKNMVTQIYAHFAKLAKGGK